MFESLRKLLDNFDMDPRYKKANHLAIDAMLSTCTPASIAISSSFNRKGNWRSVATIGAKRYDSGSVTGCNFDKHSRSISLALNKSPEFNLILYPIIDNYLSKLFEEKGFFVPSLVSLHDATAKLIGYDTLFCFPATGLLSDAGSSGLRFILNPLGYSVRAFNNFGDNLPGSNFILIEPM